MQTIVSPFAHSENEHNIAALLSDKSVERAAAIQDQLVQMFGDAIWLQRPPALHITLMEIICNADYKKLSREQHFQEWYKAYNQAVKDTLAGFSPFDVAFEELLVSQRAIIIKAADTKPFNEIRRRLMSKISLPEGTKLPPDITHCSLARFNKAIDLQEATRLTSGITVNFVEYIKEFVLIKDLGPPDFNGEPMQIYPLEDFSLA